MEKTKILVSACLLGEPCRYDGRSKPVCAVADLCDKYELIPICPECLGGLPTPRTPSERVGDRVIMADGTDVTEQFTMGAERAMEIARKNGVKVALLKAKSPSCSKGEIYDGSFTRRLVKGNGVFAEMAMAGGVSVFTEEEIDKL